MRKRIVVVEKVQMEVTIGSDYVFLYKNHGRIEIVEEITIILPEHLILVLSSL